MAGQLLNRQARLLEYLTSGDAIFRDQHDNLLDATLRGIDRRLLDLEARFSFEKRMEKIAAVYPLTLELLDAVKDAILREFVDACPPRDIGRVENARQFHEFLAQRRKRRPRLPSHVSDVAACELACALVRARLDGASPPDSASPEAIGPAVRRSHSVVLLRLAYDLRPLFEGDYKNEVTERDSWLAVTLSSGEPKISELSSDIFDVLTALDNWTALDDLPGARELVADLAQAGMLEVCP